MLDKSLVYKDIVMCLPFEDLEDLKVPVLAEVSSSVWWSISWALS